MHASHDIKPRSEVLLLAVLGVLSSCSTIPPQILPSRPAREGMVLSHDERIQRPMAKRCTAPQPCYSGHLG
jgi:hypothetical protein